MQIRIRDPESFWPCILDPGWKNSGPGSGENILDCQVVGKMSTNKQIGYCTLKIGRHTGWKMAKLEMKCMYMHMTRSPSSYVDRNHYRDDSPEFRIRIRIRTHDFGPPGSGAFYHHAKIVRKTLIPTIF
jgi:hypothetical protein